MEIGHCKDNRHKLTGLELDRLKNGLKLIFDREDGFIGKLTISCFTTPFQNMRFGKGRDQGQEHGYKVPHCIYRSEKMQKRKKV